MTSGRIGSWLLLGLILLASACGARTPLRPGEDDVDETTGDAGEEERSCLPNCTVGHQCCVGGCGGPAAETLNDCCECLSGEVDSRDCGSRCGE